MKQSYAHGISLGTADRELIAQLKGFTFFDSELHGPAHWARVHRFGVLLADHMNLSERALQCVEVFGWVHDLARVDDGGGNQHAIDGAEHAFAVVPELFPVLTEDQLLLVSQAIQYHSDGLTSDGAYFQGLLDVRGWTEDELIDTVGACWDADRLDLLRLGVRPSGRYMSTDFWEYVLPYAERLHGRNCDLCTAPKGRASRTRV